MRCVIPTGKRGTVNAVMHIVLSKIFLGVAYFGGVPVCKKMEILTKGGRKLLYARALIGRTSGV